MTTFRPLQALVEDLAIDARLVHPWGRHRAKIALEALQGSAPKGRLVLVSAMNPTPAGEGKTTTSVALAMGLRKRGRRAVVALREPSLGPVFGVKGGGTGGGLATLEPQDDINLHFTGDIHAVTAAHNLLAALVDNTILYRDPMEIDPRTVTWPRAIDMNDRALRRMVIGLGGKGFGIARETRFDITAASEVMAILCLASDIKDLEARLGRIVVGQTRDGKAVRAGDIFAGPSMTALLKDALMPNLVQTREGGPALVHGGPFGNIAHGCNSIIATKMALAYGDDVITEAGFGFDLGGEKFLDIKCRSAGLWPQAVVLVATLRSLKYQGGAALSALAEPNVEALTRGFAHIAKHLESIAGFGLPVLVALNQFPTDTADEVEALRGFLRQHKVELAISEGFAKGGEGALDLADKTLALLSQHKPSEPRFTYPLEMKAEDKIKAVAQKIYGAKEVVFTAQAREDIAYAESLGGGALPVCIAKTHLSLSDDPTKLGRPTDFSLTVREVRLSAGAGFLVALTGDILTMPGLPKVPSARRVVVHDDGRVSGLMQGS